MTTYSLDGSPDQFSPNTGQSYLLEILGVFAMMYSLPLSIALIAIVLVPS